MNLVVLMENFYLRRRLNVLLFFGGWIVKLRTVNFFLINSNKLSFPTFPMKKIFPIRFRNPTRSQ